MGCVGVYAEGSGESQGKQAFGATQEHSPPTYSLESRVFGIVRCLVWHSAGHLQPVVVWMRQSNLWGSGRINYGIVQMILVWKHKEVAEDEKAKERGNFKLANNPKTKQQQQLEKDWGN